MTFWLSFDHFHDIFQLNLFESHVNNQYIRMNTGHWHKTMLGTSQKKIRLNANSAVFLVLQFHCQLALQHCFSIPCCANSCPPAGSKAVLLPSPITASLLSLTALWRRLAFSLILNLNNVKSSFFSLDFYLYARTIYNTHGEKQ